MHKHIRSLSTAVALATLLAAAGAAQHPAMPPGVAHDDHVAQMRTEADLKRRGEAAMGFDPNTSTHHFTLTPGGGRIQVAVTDPSNATGVAQIRTHLAAIATAFADGNFGAPFATHGEIPPGVTTLQARRQAIRYRYDETANGGRVVIETSDGKARSAIHMFLRYQIREHGTGDSLTIAK